MYKKLNNLGFIIGLFFIIISVVLIIVGISSDGSVKELNFYTGFSFLVFSLLMMFFNRNNSSPGSSKDQ